jgi:tRNA-2-methylthio-N6-dimethylallyladenosine synthase
LYLIREVRFDVLRTAAYSPRPNTPAAHWENQASEAERVDGLARTIKLHEEIALERSKCYLSHVDDILTSTPKDPSSVIGRTPAGKLTKLAGDLDALRGKLVPVRATAVTALSRLGRVAGDPK